MIKSVEFKYFKVLRDATLPLSQFTLIVGPNGCGKTTALQGLLCLGGKLGISYASVVSAGARKDTPNASVSPRWGKPWDKFNVWFSWVPTLNPRLQFDTGGKPLHEEDLEAVLRELRSIEIYALDARAIALPVHLEAEVRLASDGKGLAGVLDRMRDNHPERFEALNHDLGHWLPEFDRVLFETPQPGHRGILLRTREGGYSIRAADLSQGTLLALTIMTLAWLPDPPSIVCFEEPDRGLHPRLLRDVRDALYRLAYPEGFEEKRPPVQVIATTHSPYMLDLFRDHPDEIVIANRVGDNVRFERLSDRKDLDEILRDSHLGDVWYSGILGGVPDAP